MKTYPDKFNTNYKKRVTLLNLLIIKIYYIFFKSFYFLVNLFYIQCFMFNY